jgi:hypothetical protein
MATDMNIYVLSELHPSNTHVGWSVSYSLEKILVESCGAIPIYPIEDKEKNLLQRYQHRLLKSWFKISEPPVLGNGPNVLIVIGLGARFLLSMLALGPLLQKFDLKIAYLLDGIDPAEIDREVIPHLDHLFLITAEMVDEVTASLPLKASFLPLATDVLRQGAQHLGNRLERGIDIINYGRTQPELHQVLQRYYNQGDSQRMYFHTTFTGTNVASHQEHIMLMTKLLNKSKINICFEPSALPRFRGYSPLLLRWLEGWACGCAIVGKRPFGKGVGQLLNWENSTLELPDNSSDWIPFFEDLLNNEALLLEISQRNYQECLLRHDWRYRIRDIFTTLSLPIPAQLQLEIDLVQTKAERAKQYAFSDSRLIEPVLAAPNLAQKAVL